MTRAFDVALASIVVCVISPVLIVVAIVVRLSSRGPVFFRQERVGLHGRLFNILKFRTMRQNASEQSLAPLVTSDGDPRITRVGQSLRSTKLDELPQLLNVVLGEMSLVGPRPEVPKYAAEWSPSQREVILSVRPGITDPASVRFRRESKVLANQSDPEFYYITEILPEKAAIYVEYVERRSFFGDLKILFQTVRHVVGG